MGETLGLLAFGDKGWGDEILAGLGVTISLFLATLPFGIFFGFLIALAKRSNNRLARLVANAYTTIFRGLPELLTLFIIFYGGQMLLQQLADLLFDGVYVELNAFVAGIIALAFVFSAYASETFMSAFNGIPDGQAEAARSLGLGRVQTLRLVIFPQLVRLALPGLANLSLILQKDTSLVSIIALPDLIRNTRIAVGVTKEPLFFFSVACMIYIALAVITSYFIGVIDRWSSRGQAGRS